MPSPLWLLLSCVNWLIDPGICPLYNGSIYGLIVSTNGIIKPFLFVLVWLQLCRISAGDIYQRVVNVCYV